MKIGHTELIVSNPAKSQKFYKEVLGFETVSVQSDRLVWMKLDSWEVLLRAGAKVPGTGDFHTAPSNIVFYTDDLDETKKNLSRKGLEFREQDNGCDTFTDLDGNWFQIVDPKHA